MPAKLKLQPTEARCFVEYNEAPLPDEVGGILLPSTFDRNQGQVLYVEATIVATGPLCTQVHVGDKVIMAKTNIERVKFGELVYHLIVERSITGIVVQ
jgi:co-chaperonin GroES (HSP10)